MTRARHRHGPRTDKGRVAFTSWRYHTNQVGAVKALQDRGWTVGYFALYEGTIEDHTLLDPVVLGDGFPFRLVRAFLCWRGRVHPYNERAFRTRWGCPPLRAFWRGLRKFHPDVVIIRDTTLPYCILSLVFTRVQGGQPIVQTLTRKYVNAGRAKRLLGRFVTAMLRCEWITHVEGDTANGATWSKHVHYLPLPIEITRLPRRPHRSPADPLRIMCVGKFVKQKNLSLMVEAFERVGDGSRACLTIVGECSSSAHEKQLRDLERLIAHRGLNSLVTVLTNVPFNHMGSLYDRQDLFVLPSSGEALGVVILEAMAHGLPVVCSDTAGAQWYIEPGGNGHVFRSDDVEDLTRVLRMFLDDPSHVRRMGRRSLELAVTRHSPDCYFRSFLAAIHDVHQ